MTTTKKNKANMNGHITEETLTQQIKQLENDASVALVNHHRLVGAANALRSILGQMQTVSTEIINDGNNDATERT
jgi:DNA-binding HxlR family transcriptional regulator